MTQNTDKTARRTIIEDLVRIVAEVKNLLNRELPVLHRPGPKGSWSLAEIGLHLVMTLEDCHQRFGTVLEDSSQTRPAASLGQILNQKVILTTFRYPSGLQAESNLLPRIMLAEDEICLRLEEAKDQLLMVEAALYGQQKTLKVTHPQFGPMSFFHWVRLLLIHCLHHKILSNKGL